MRVFESLLALSAIGVLILGSSAASTTQTRKAPSDAQTKVHWSWTPLRRVRPPVVKNESWPRTPIDHFILATLEKRGMKPSAPADRRTLIRRVTFDLTGLPPIPEEVDAFVRSSDPRAYEKLVDRLLASPRYGERWARHWLDVAHFGDTHGYDKDKRRDNAWRYRDYVIRALNQDKPYGRFVKEQIAGDVLWPESADAVIATGFVAAGPWDFVGHEELREGTIEKEKTRVLDRDDMVANTFSTFNSVTVHCARCHDHKFDPIPQRDYYRLQACFAGVERRDRPIPDGSYDSRRQELITRRDALATERKKLDELAAKSAAEDSGVQAIERSLAQTRTAIKMLPPVLPGSPSATNGYHSEVSAAQDAVKWVQVDLGHSMPVERIRLVPARPTDFPDTPGFGFPVRFKVQLAENEEFDAANTLLDATASDFANPRDRVVTVNGGAKRARYVRLTATRLWKRTGDYVFALGEMQILSGGRNVAQGAKVTALDSIEAGRWAARNLVDGFDSHRQLPDLSDPATASVVEQADALHEREQQLQQEREQARVRAIPGDIARKQANVAHELSSVEAQMRSLPPQPLVYALRSREPRQVSVLARGEVDKPLEPAAPGALEVVPGLKSLFSLPAGSSEGARRAALADWVASPRNALTWRSIVNRVWHYHFGKGIVDTPNDFGKNGGAPSHPELLDWLAAAFATGASSAHSDVRLGQSLKALHRLIVLSAVYRQSSADNTAYARMDGGNRLLWRMNRQRLDAESIRDSVLAVSGKLDFKMGGPGFELFQFKDDHSPVYDHSAIERVNDPRGWRRSVYRFVVRSVPNPFMESLDCADPNINTPVRNATLTALQALTLLNNPFMVDQSGHFARRVSQETAAVEDQIRLACRLAFSREPSSVESVTLTTYARKHGLAAACRLLLNANEFVFVD